MRLREEDRASSGSRMPRLRCVRTIHRRGGDFARTGDPMLDVRREALKPFASKYIWWKAPEDAVAWPERVIAQVMNIGDYADVQALVAEVGEEVLREVLAHAEAGQFNERSWAYWHYRLGLARLGEVPALPSRRFP